VTGPWDGDSYDQRCAAVGLHVVERWATWDREPFHQRGDYAVTVSAAGL
jgi:hypothetical protein